MKFSAEISDTNTRNLFRHRCILRHNLQRKMRKSYHWRKAHFKRKPSSIYIFTSYDPPIVKMDLTNKKPCTATFMYNARISWPVFYSPNLLLLIFWNDCYGGFLALKSSVTTPFYCLKCAPFCERHSFLCIVLYVDGRTKHCRDWYYSILLLSIIINSVTFVTDDFIFAKIERIIKLLHKNVF